MSMLGWWCYCSFVFNWLICPRADSLYDISTDILHNYVFHRTPKYWFEYIIAFFYFKFNEVQMNHNRLSHISSLLYVEQMSKIFTGYTTKSPNLNQTRTRAVFSECTHNIVLEMNHAKGKKLSFLFLKMILSFIITGCVSVCFYQSYD